MAKSLSYFYCTHIFLLILVVLTTHTAVAWFTMYFPWIPCADFVLAYYSADLYIGMIRYVGTRVQPSGLYSLKNNSLALYVNAWIAYVYINAMPWVVYVSIVSRLLATHSAWITPLFNYWISRKKNKRQHCTDTHVTPQPFQMGGLASTPVVVAWPEKSPKRNSPSDTHYQKAKLSWTLTHFCCTLGK